MLAQQGYPSVFCACPAVGDFQKLVHWSEKDALRTKTIQRVLKLTRGWEAAADHAKSAVPADTRFRTFLSDTGFTLLYPCNNGKVDIEQTAGGFFQDPPAAFGCKWAADESVAFAAISTTIAHACLPVRVRQRPSKIHCHKE